MRPGERGPRCYDATQMEIQERTEDIVSLTPAAAAKIRDLMAGEEDVSVLRVAIEGGGCSGFQYGLGFDRGAQEGDHEFECEGVNVVVDPFSAPYLMGAQVDYLETIQESGFKIENPNASPSATWNEWPQPAAALVARTDASVRPPTLGSAGPRAVTRSRRPSGPSPCTAPTGRPTRRVQ